MAEVGVRELKARLSEDLARARSGESVVVTDRGKPIARLMRSGGEFTAWFGTDEDCVDYLEWLRWP